MCLRGGTQQVGRISGYSKILQKFMPSYILKSCKKIWNITIFCNQISFCHAHLHCHSLNHTVINSINVEVRTYFKTEISTRCACETSSPCWGHRVKVRSQGSCLRLLDPKNGHVKYGHLCTLGRSKVTGKVKAYSQTYQQIERPKTNCLQSVNKGT